jgi:hypothetical protein
MKKKNGFRRASPLFCKKGATHKKYKFYRRSKKVDPFYI